MSRETTIPPGRIGDDRRTRSRRYNESPARSSLASPRLASRLPPLSFSVSVSFVSALVLAFSAPATSLLLPVALSRALVVSLLSSGSEVLVAPTPAVGSIPLPSPRPRGSVPFFSPRYLFSEVAHRLRRSHRRLHPVAQFALISSVTGHRARRRWSARNTPVSYELTRRRSAGGRQCCAPSQNPCSAAGTIITSPRLCLLPSSASHMGTSFHAGTTTTKESRPPAASASSSNLRRARRRRSVSGTNGGFISNDPRVGLKSKKEPREPKGASTSGKAEQKRP